MERSYTHTSYSEYDVHAHARAGETESGRSKPLPQLTGTNVGRRGGRGEGGGGGKVVAHKAVSEAVGVKDHGYRMGEYM